MGAPAFPNRSCFTANQGTQGGAVLVQERLAGLTCPTETLWCQVAKGVQVRLPEPANLNPSLALKLCEDPRPPPPGSLLSRLVAPEEFYSPPPILFSLRPASFSLIRSKPRPPFPLWLLIGLLSRRLLPLPARLAARPLFLSPLPFPPRFLSFFFFCLSPRKAFRDL